MFYINFSVSLCPHLCVSETDYNKAFQHSDFEWPAIFELRSRMSHAWWCHPVDKIAHTDYFSLCKASYLQNASRKWSGASAKGSEGGRGESESVWLHFFIFSDSSKERFFLQGMSRIHEILNNAHCKSTQCACTQVNGPVMRRSVNVLVKYLSILIVVQLFKWTMCL